MNDWLRRAGRGQLAHDDVVLWSVAEGARGRRWRWMHQLYRGGAGHSGMIEILPDGQLGRLELSAFGGLLTFHPESDGLSANGNIVTAEGVKPIETSWRPEWRVGIVDDPFGSAVAGWSGSGLVISWQLDGLVWREPGTYDDVAAIDCDERGIPILDNAQEWPLED